MLNDVLEVVAQNQPIIMEVCHNGYAKLVMEVLDHSKGHMLHNGSCRQTFHWHFIYIFWTVHLCIILVGNQLDAQFLLWYVYLNPLHVSSNYVLILRRTIVLTLKTPN